MFIGSLKAYKTKIQGQVERKGWRKKRVASTHQCPYLVIRVGSVFVNAKGRVRGKGGGTGRGRADGGACQVYSEDKVSLSGLSLSSVVAFVLAAVD